MEVASPEQKKWLEVKQEGLGEVQAEAEELPLIPELGQTPDP